MAIQFSYQPIPKNTFLNLELHAIVIVARGRGFANLLFTQLCCRLTRSALLCYSDGYYL